MAYPAILGELQQLYGLDEAGVIERLAREEVAAEQFAQVMALGLKEYAGAWFDAATQRLHVAISDRSATATIESIGAVPVLVTHSLSQLEQISSAIDADLADQPVLRDAIVSRSINYRANSVEVSVLPEQSAAVLARISQAGYAGSVVRVTETDSVPMLSADVRGADGTRNHTWSQTYGGTWPCSIGVSIVGGYVTAGHCGYAGNVMHTPSGQLLGTVQASQWGSGVSAPSVL